MLTAALVYVGMDIVFSLIAYTIIVRNRKAIRQRLITFLFQ